jgi:hypothetical protein
MSRFDLPIPYSIIKLQASSGLIETGWNFERNAASEMDGPLFLPKPQIIDTHVTKTRETTWGTVACYHVAARKGLGEFDAREVDLVYTGRMWKAVEPVEFFNTYSVAE